MENTQIIKKFTEEFAKDHTEYWCEKHGSFMGSQEPDESQHLVNGDDYLHEIEENKIDVVEEITEAMLNDEKMRDFLYNMFIETVFPIIQGCKDGN